MTEPIPAGEADRRQLRQIVADLAEGVMLLEANGAIVWSNAAALAMHGAATAAQLGANIAEYRERFQLCYRNNHPLDQGQYPIERAAAGETFAAVVVEVTTESRPDDRWVHEARSLILTDSAGEPECLVLILVDKTDEINAEERFERAFNANPAPAIICRLSDLRYIKVNRGFLQMSGYARDQVVGRTVYDLDVLEHAEQKAEAVALLRDGATIPQLEARLRIQDGSHKYVIVAGQPIEIGDEHCMLFTFIDLDSRKRAEDALRQSEERSSKAFSLSPLPTIITTLDDCRLRDANEAFLTTFGCTAEQVIGHPATELGLWMEGAGLLRHLQALRRDGQLSNQEIRVRGDGGQVMDCLLSAYTFTAGGALCAVCVLQDVTERKRTEAELIGALDSVMQDASWFSRTVIEKLAQLRRPAANPDSCAGIADLTAREMIVLGLMCEALDDQAIADRLHISRNTVRNHVGSIYRKIDVHNRSAAIVWARDRGITSEAASPAKRRRPRIRGH
jgi:PAS domain S-box-containing protein